MQRRKFIVAIVNTIAAAPMFGLRLVSAQQAEQVRRVGVLMGLSESNPEHRNLFAAFLEELALLGWVDGRTARIEQRWTDGDVKRASAFATELVAAQPDVILASTTPVTAALHRETTTIPIVFATVSDPISAGFVASMPRPGGNITGFTHVDPAFGGKWLGLLKEIAPNIKRAGIISNPDTAPRAGNFFLGSFEAAARLLAIDPVNMPVRTDDEIETAIAGLGPERAGVVVAADSFMAVHFGTVISSTTRHNVPAICETRELAKEGGLISYGADYADIFRRAASYVDRILRGEKPADLPVQAPIKFELTVNLETARALGIDVPSRLLAIADEVLE
jgi:putative tryptophan/tyrosine transport system substrate-binding protein